MCFWDGLISCVKATGVGNATFGIGHNLDGAARARWRDSSECFFHLSCSQVWTTSVCTNLNLWRILWILFSRNKSIYIYTQTKTMTNGGRKCGLHMAKTRCIELYFCMCKQNMQTTIYIYKPTNITISILICEIGWGPGVAVLLRTVGPNVCVWPLGTGPWGKCSSL